MAKTLVGLDLGHYSIKIVEVIKKKKKMDLISCNLRTIPRGASFEDKLNSVRTLYKESRVSNPRVKISVAGKNVITRYAVFPSLSKRDLARSLKFEFEKYIPFPMHESVVDLDILEKRTDGNLNVLIASAKKHFINERVKFIRQVGLIPESISVDSLALYKTFAESPYFSKEKSFILLNIGARISNLIIVRHKTPVFSRDINIGGENFTSSISDKMDLPFHKAEELKYNPDPNSIFRTISIDLNAMVNEMELSIEYAKRNYGLGDIQCVYLSGGSAKFKGLDKILEDSLKIKVDLWNPFIKLQKAKQFNILQEYYPDLILSLGIALT